MYSNGNHNIVSSKLIDNNQISGSDMMLLSLCFTLPLSFPAVRNTTSEIFHQQQQHDHRTLHDHQILHYGAGTTACCDATQEAAVPTVSAGPCTLPLYQKPLDPTGRRTKALGGEVRLTVAVAPP